MNMDMLSRGFDILQRAGGMEQISQLMVIVYGVLCVFGLLNCILGYRILRFWMMIFGFIIGAGAGFGVTYMSGVQDKMVIAGAMAGLGIVLAVVSFLIYRAGIFVLGFGIGITLKVPLTDRLLCSGSVRQDPFQGLLFFFQPSLVLPTYNFFCQEAITLCSCRS